MMGIFTSCCRPSSAVVTPDVDIRRKQMIEAVEKRKELEDKRGISDPEKLRRQQKKQEEIEKRERELSQQGGAVLKWQSN